jgi:CRISPR-associated protein Csh1
MLEAMRIQALDFLFQKISEGNPPDRLDTWYQKTIEEAPKEIFPYLVEPLGKIEKVYIIQKKLDEPYAILHIEEMRPEIEKFLPFVKPIGSQSAQIGPIIKRTFDKKKKAGPSEKIINTTMKYFENLSESKKPWSSYFRDILDILNTESIIMLDGKVIDWSKFYSCMLDCVIDKIGPENKTTLITVKSKGKFPGEILVYFDYLMNEVLAGERFLTAKIKSVPDSECGLCSSKKCEVYPNALKGAGINLTNIDRVGRFSELSLSNAWKSYALCRNCANLLYVYKNHVLKPSGPKNDTRPFTSAIAGDNALVIPHCTTTPETRFEIWNEVKAFVDSSSQYVVGEEESILDIMARNKGIFNLTFLWANIGQLIEKVTGILTDVPPTRLNFLSQFNDQTENWNHPVFPEKLLRNQNDYLDVNLSLSAFRSLFRRPGGKKAPNATRRLAEIKRFVAASIYHGRKLNPKFMERIYDEIQITASWWWLDAILRDDTYAILNQGKSKKKKEGYLTISGWIRHWAWWLYYFKKLGVLDMEQTYYEPQWEGLKVYMGGESGIDSKEKAFAFLLGVVYGRLILIQESAGFKSSSLNWVKRFSIDGRALPDLYKKVLSKLLEYQKLSDKEFGRLFTERVYRAIEELSLVGTKLGDRIELPSNLTCYYLLLGLSLSNKILKKE